MYTELYHFLLLFLLFFNIVYFFFKAFVTYTVTKIFGKNRKLSYLPRKFKQSDFCRKANKLRSQFCTSEQLSALGQGILANPLLLKSGYIPPLTNISDTPLRWQNGSYRTFFGINFTIFNKLRVFIIKRIWTLQNQNKFSYHLVQNPIKKKAYFTFREEVKKKLCWVFSFFFLISTCCLYGTISNYICSDFTIYNIITNSTADVPTFYKISATWSNHEGSLLLWYWLLSFSSFLVCINIYDTLLFKRNFQIVTSLD